MTLNSAIFLTARVLTIMPYLVFASSHFIPASSAAYAYSLRASLNSCTNMYVMLQLVGSKYANGLSDTTKHTELIQQQENLQGHMRIMISVQNVITEE